MGEYAEYMLNGDDCSGCGEYLGNGDGFARFCAGCRSEQRRLKPVCDAPKVVIRNVPCTHRGCNRKFPHEEALKQHLKFYIHKG